MMAVAFICEQKDTLHVLGGSSVPLFSEPATSIQQAFMHMAGTIFRLVLPLAASFGRKNERPQICQLPLHVDNIKLTPC